MNVSARVKMVMSLTTSCDGAGMSLNDVFDAVSEALSADASVATSSSRLHRSRSPASSVLPMTAISTHCLTRRLTLVLQVQRRVQLCVIRQSAVCNDLPMSRRRGTISCTSFTIKSSLQDCRCTSALWQTAMKISDEQGHHEDKLGARYFRSALRWTLLILACFKYIVGALRLRDFISARLMQRQIPCLDTCDTPQVRARPIALTVRVMWSLTPNASQNAQVVAFDNAVFAAEAQCCLLCTRNT